MKQVRVGITMGDPAGIGPEIVAKAVNKKGIQKKGRILIIGDNWVFNKFVAGRSKNSRIEFTDLNNVSRRKFQCGKVKPEYGRASIDYLKKAVELIKNKKLDCLVTAPISKEAINQAGYNYNGHTEFFAEAFGKKKDELVMLLLNKYLKISLATRHLALNKVSTVLSRKMIYKNIIITYKALISYFGIINPKICVAALNPHAGERGLLGKEEIRLIVPTIKKAKRIIKDLKGPLPADAAFLAARRGHFDAVIAMYHDQALIPLKLLDFESGVNITLGLDFVRTSPLHGTGFDIAGKGIASETSLVTAINTAIDCTQTLSNAKRVSLY